MAENAQGVNQEIKRERLTREQTSRTAAELLKEWTEWKPVGFTDAPPPLDGFEQLWARCRAAGVDDIQNFLKRKQQGWRPRPAETLPADFLHLKQKLDDRFGDWGSVIGNQDCILMHRPKWVGDKARAELQRQTQRLEESVRQVVRSNLPPQHGMSGGAVEKFKVETETKRVPAFQDD